MKAIVRDGYGAPEQVLKLEEVDHLRSATTMFEEDFTRSEPRYDVILDNVMNRRPSATAHVLAPTGTLIPNSVGNTGGLFAGLPRMRGRR